MEVFEKAQNVNAPIPILVEDGRVNAFWEQICHICIDSSTMFDVHDIWTAAHKFVLRSNDRKRAYEPAVA